MKTHLLRHASIGFVCIGMAVGSGYAQEPKQSGRPPDSNAGAQEVVPQEPAQPTQPPAGPAKLVLTGEAARRILDLVGGKVNAANAVVGQELGVVKGVLLLPATGQAKAAAPAVGEVYIVPGAGVPQPIPPVVAVPVKLRVLAAAPVRSCASAVRPPATGASTSEKPAEPQPPAASHRALGITLEVAPAPCASARLLGTVLVPVQTSVGAMYLSTGETFAVPNVFGTSALYADQAMLADLHLRREAANARLGLLAPDGSSGGRTWKTEAYRGTGMTPYYFRQERPGDNWLWFRDLEKEQEVRRRTIARTPSRVMHSW